jgi:radical SAM protein with 4Fe4S-binding SPASM domain
MVTLFDNNIVFSQHAKFVKNQESVIIINGDSGIWGVIDASIFERISDCITNKISPITYIKDIGDEPIRAQLTEIFQVLIDENVIKSASDTALNIDIKELEFKLTNRCNLKCLHCAASSDISNGDGLSTEQIIMILDKVLKLKLEKLLLTGGEPLIRQDIRVILSYIKRNYKGIVNLSTNGILIDKEMAFMLKECVDAVLISMDGYDEKSTEYIRGKGVYPKIIQAISYLKEVGFTKENISLSMVCTSQNIEHREDFYKLCEKLEVTGVIMQFSALGRGLENYLDLGMKDYLFFNRIKDEELETIRENLECKIFCEAGVNKIAINELGDMYPCLVLDSEEYKFANILTGDIEEIINSKHYHEFIINKFKRSIVDGLPKCKDCNVRYFCMDRCIGVSESYYSNKKICEERCKQMRPYLTKVLWEE